MRKVWRRRRGRTFNGRGKTEQTASVENPDMSLCVGSVEELENGQPSFCDQLI